jgi:hypothetical protein
MEYFASIRLRGKLEDTGKWMNSDEISYVDISISKEETERIVKFLKSCLEDDEKKGS